MKKAKVYEITEPVYKCGECNEEICECDCPDCRGDKESMVVQFEEGDTVYCMGALTGNHFCKACVDRMKKEKRK